ncbi:MAG: SIMPL domain-containing protein [Alphaproteobacteria bacterium]|nr:SIMPL domain-containing protein [Alphaproteobacteria bacterium]
MEDKTKIAAAAVVAAGLALGGFFPGYYYYQTHHNARTVTVKGLAEQDVQADMGIWTLQFTVSGNDLNAEQTKIVKQAGEVQQFLLRSGFAENEISVGRIETTDLMANPYRDAAALESSRFILSQTITVRSGMVKKIAEAMSNSNELIAKGIVFSSQNANYFFTKLNDIKPKLLQEATQNANKSAQEFAASSGSRVGQIYQANQGVISVQPRDDPNAFEPSQIDKRVRVVSTVTYLLQD